MIARSRWPSNRDPKSKCLKGKTALATTDTKEPESTLSQRHLQFGWWTLLLFLLLGVILEYLLATESESYASDNYATRRLVWRLAHVHGSLIAVLHIAFGLTASLVPTAKQGFRRAASTCLMAASILLPGGFFAGGIFFFDGDPGLGIFLVPVGAVTLFVAALLTAMSLGKSELLISPPEAEGSDS